MEALNIVQIEEKIKNDLSEIRTPADLLALQKWARKAKKQKVIQPTVTSFKQMYYHWESSIRSNGSGKFIGRKLNKVDYTSFVFLGLEIKLPISETRYVFSDDDFTSHRIWVDRTIKYGGTEYFPKHPLDEYFGIDLEKMFFDYVKQKEFYIVKKNEKVYFLCNNDRNAVKAMMGRRLTQFDTCNNPVIKLSKEQVEYLHFLEVRDWDYFYPPNDDKLDSLPF
jgi:hypothetical protein